jgi:hypothetical protein
MMPLSLFEDPLMTNPAVVGTRSMPVAVPTSRDLVVSSRPRPPTSQDGGRMEEEATAGAYEGV